MCLVLENLRSWSQPCHDRQRSVWPSCTPSSILRSNHSHIPGERASPTLPQEMLFLNSAAKFLLQLWCPWEVSADGLGVLGRGRRAVNSFLRTIQLKPTLFFSQTSGKNKHCFKDRSPFYFTAVCWSSCSRPVRNDSTGCEELGYSPSHLELMK